MGINIYFYGDDLIIHTDNIDGRAIIKRDDLILWLGLEGIAKPDKTIKEIWTKEDCERLAGTLK